MQMCWREAQPCSAKLKPPTGKPLSTQSLIMNVPLYTHLVVAWLNTTHGKANFAVRETNSKITCVSGNGRGMRDMHFQHQRVESTSWWDELLPCSDCRTQGNKERENWAQEAATAGKDTADLICFEKTSSLQLNAIYKQRAKDYTHIHTHSLCPCPTH